MVLGHRVSKSPRSTTRLGCGHGKEQLDAALSGVAFLRVVPVYGKRGLLVEIGTVTTGHFSVGNGRVPACVTGSVVWVPGLGPRVQSCSSAGPPVARAS